MTTETNGLRLFQYLDNPSSTKNVARRKITSCARDLSSSHSVGNERSRWRTHLDSRQRLEEHSYWNDEPSDEGVAGMLLTLGYAVPIGNERVALFAFIQLDVCIVYGHYGNCNGGTHLYLQTNAIQ